MVFTAPMRRAEACRLLVGNRHVDAAEAQVGEAPRRGGEALGAHR
jgi:hypothetical protein